MTVNEQARHIDGRFATMGRSEVQLGEGGIDLLATAYPAEDESAYADPVVVEDDAEDTGPLPQRTSYTFLAEKLPLAIASIEKANRRAERAGIPERFTYATTTFTERTEDAAGIIHLTEKVELELDRPTIAHDGWEFVGTLNWDPEAGLITRTVPGASLTDRPDDALCDACGKRRTRRDTYVVQRTDEDGNRTQMQVGSDCLQRFMGMRPQGLFMLEFDLDEDELNSSSGPRDPRGEAARYDSRQVLAMAVAAVARDGWTSRAAARAYMEASGGEASKAATADTVGYGLWGDPNPRDREAVAELAALRAEAAAVTDENIDALLEAARNLDGDSEYAINLRALASVDSVHPRNIGTLISIIGSIQAQERRASERATQDEANASSRHVGIPGQRSEFSRVTVESARFYDNAYQGKTLVSMRDADGNIIKWWASGDQTHLQGDYAMKATVKEHGEFRGALETTVQRAKLEALED